MSKQNDISVIIEKNRLKNINSIVVEPQKSIAYDLNVTSRNEYSLFPRLKVCGKFLYRGNEKFWMRGISYGSFRPDVNNIEFPDPEVVEQDFNAISQHGINTIRTYTAPPIWLLDIAQKYNLGVMLELLWIKHMAIFHDKKIVKSIKKDIREMVKNLSQHPAIYCYSIGNEIPASIVRYYGRRKIELFLKNLYDIVKTEDPDGLVTYVNYPTTEYLSLPFLDIVCFNVYLEDRNNLESYLARLQNIAGDRPLLLSEIGLDSRRNGLEEQARSIAWQLQTAFSSGCAGAVVFKWSDEWYSGGHNITDWDFGLITRDGQDKPALAAVRRAFCEIPFSSGIQWPKISVVLCSYNGARTIRQTLEELVKLDYPDYEIIVVNDGSTDDTPKIAAEYQEIRLITIENSGLSYARNIGFQEALGEIVAYIDDDAYPDIHWLKYLASAFLNSSFAGIGGSNLLPPESGMVAHCVNNAPGGPIHVLISDREAEHIPGCNMAFRKNALSAVGGFDLNFRVAGDDVDLCWRIQQNGWKIGFIGSALVWHHRRSSIKAYLKQQYGYGKAEALLEEKWPEKYNVVGHAIWNGRLYGKGLTQPIISKRWHVYQGKWGSALFQSLYQSKPDNYLSLPLMPEWYLGILFMSFLSFIGISWQPLLLTMPILIIALNISIMQAILSAYHASIPVNDISYVKRCTMRLIIAFLHLAQPIARLLGRINNGLTPWRVRTMYGLVVPRKRYYSIWSEIWHSSNEWLEFVSTLLLIKKISFVNGSDFDNWDIMVRGGIFSSAYLLMAVEEHGTGKQMLRFKIWPRISRLAVIVTLFVASLSFWAYLDKAWIACLMLSMAVLMCIIRILLEGSMAMSCLIYALKKLNENEMKKNDCS